MFAATHNGIDVIVSAAALGYLICSDSSFDWLWKRFARLAERRDEGGGGARVSVAVETKKARHFVCRPVISFSLLAQRSIAMTRCLSACIIQRKTYVMTWVFRVRAPIIIMIAAKWVVLLAGFFVPRHRNVLDNYISHWLPFRNDLYFTLLIRLSACLHCGLICYRKPLKLPEVGIEMNFCVGELQIRMACAHVNRLIMSGDRNISTPGRHIKPSTRSTRFLITPHNWTKWFAGNKINWFCCKISIKH